MVCPLSNDPDFNTKIVKTDYFDYDGNQHTFESNFKMVWPSPRLGPPRRLPWWVLHNQSPVDKYNIPDQEEAAINQERMADLESKARGKVKG